MTPATAHPYPLARRPPRLSTQKLVPPGGPRHVVRQAFVAELDERSAGVELVVVEAPAGFGKTSLLRLWHARRAARGDVAAWLTFDADDNDPGRFVEHLHAALGPTAAADPRDALGPTVDASVDAVIAQVDALRAGPRAVSLFIDEVETMRDDSVVRLVADLSRRLPPHGTLFVSGRRIPDLHVSRRRTSGRAMVLGADDLRFSAQDAGDLLRSIAGPGLAGDVIARIHERTEGWAAALHLAGLSLAGRDAGVGDVAALSEAPVALSRYLAEEILATQPHDVRDLLLGASLFETVSVKLCEDVLGCADATRLLEHIEAENLFISRVGPQTYRLHQLFREFLAEELTRSDPDAVAAFHRDAAQWFARENRPTSAIRHVLASGDSSLAGEVLEEHVRPLAAAGRLTTVARACDDLPRDVLRQRPRLAAYYAACLVGTFQHRRAGELIDELMTPELLDALDDDALGVLLFAVSFQLVLQDRFAEALAQCDTSLHRLGDSDAQGRTALLNVRSICLLHLHRYREIEAVDAEVRRLAAHATSYGLVYAECLSGMTDLAQGRLSAADTTFATALQTAVAESSPTSAATAVAAACLLETRYEHGDLAAATELVARYLPTITAVGVPDAVIQAHVHNIRLTYRRDGYLEACSAINQLKRLGYERDLARLVACAGAEHAQLALLEGDLASARRYLELVEATTPYATLWDESGTTIRARLLIAEDRPRDAIALVAPELRRAEAQGRLRYALKLRTILAVARRTAGEAGAALDAVERCIAETHADGHVQTFLREGQVIVDLLRELLATRRCAPPVRAGAERLLDEAARQASPTPHVDELEPLSPRELEVLTLVADGLSNQQIADRLVLSLPTVKTHVARILGKLAAKNRTEAVATARRRRFLAV